MNFFKSIDKALQDFDRKLNDATGVNKQNRPQNQAGYYSQPPPGAQYGQPHGQPYPVAGQPYPAGPPVAGQPYPAGPPVAGQPYPTGPPVAGQPYTGQPASQQASPYPQWQPPAQVAKAAPSASPYPPPPGQQVASTPTSRSAPPAPPAAPSGGYAPPATAQNPPAAGVTAQPPASAPPMPPLQFQATAPPSGPASLPPATTVVVPVAAGAFEKTLPARLLKKDGSTVDKAVLQGKTVAVFQTAHWAPTARRFTSDLAKFYEEYKALDANFEVVLCSSDGCKKDMMDDFAGHADYLAFDFDAPERKAMAHLISSSGVPSLVVFDATGHVLTRDGVELVKKGAHAVKASNWA